MVRRDPELLMMLASLPNNGFYAQVRQNARDALLPHAAALIANPTTSARTLFLLATTVAIYWYPADSLRVRLARHPNARGNLAIQLVTHPSAIWQEPARWAEIMAMVKASPRVRLALARFLDPKNNGDKTIAAAELLADAETGHNPDVLLVLANLGPNMLVAWEATRRLPPTALARWEQYWMPSVVMPVR